MGLPQGPPSGGVDQCQQQIALSALVERAWYEGYGDCSVGAANNISASPRSKGFFGLDDLKAGTERTTAGIISPLELGGLYYGENGEGAADPNRTRILPSCIATSIYEHLFVGRTQQSSEPESEDDTLQRVTHTGLNCQCGESGTKVRLTSHFIALHQLQNDYPTLIPIIQIWLSSIKDPSLKRKASYS